MVWDEASRLTDQASTRDADPRRAGDSCRRRLSRSTVVVYMSLTGRAQIRDEKGRAGTSDPRRRAAPTSAKPSVASTELPRHDAEGRAAFAAQHRRGPSVPSLEPLTPAVDRNGTHLGRLDLACYAPACEAQGRQCWTTDDGCTHATLHCCVLTSVTRRTRFLWARQGTTRTGTTASFVRSRCEGQDAGPDRWNAREVQHDRRGGDE